MNRQLEIAEFRKLAMDGSAIPSSVIRLATTGEPIVLPESRTATFVFSDDSVDLYGDTIDQRGWDTSAFENNPIALFGHDSSKPEYVVGRAKNLRVQGNRLVGDIEFMEASINPTADVVYQMVKGGFLNAVSVGFRPLEWTLSKDKSRPGGISFTKQQLMEISIVPLPANQNALVQARAAGIDVDRLGLTEQASAPPIKIKSLWHVAFLADILMDLDMLEDCVEWEAAMEEDGSDIPDRLTGALQALGAILIDMTKEEVAELLADPDDVGTTDAVVADPVELSARASRMKLLKSLVKADPQVMGAVLEALAPKEKTGLVDLLAIKSGIAVAKAGKVLSSDNEKKLREANDLHTKACEIINDVLGSNMPAATEEKTQVVETDDDKAVRTRRARALKMRVAIETAA